MKYLLITAKEENEPNIGILMLNEDGNYPKDCLLYTSPSPRD